MARKINVTLGQFKAGITRHADMLRRHGLLEQPGSFGVYAPKKTGYSMRKYSRGSSRFNKSTFGRRPKTEERLPSLTALEEFTGAAEE